MLGSLVPVGLPALMRACGWWATISHGLPSLMRGGLYTEYTAQVGCRAAAVVL